jgi:hypothetical protein
MDAPTISAFAAAGAATVAATVAGIQFYVGRRQAEASLTSANAALMNAQNAGQHRIAQFRQEWIDKVIDTLCEHHSILMSCDRDHPLSRDDEKKMSALRTKLEILLNPDENETIALLNLIDEIARTTDRAERDKKDSEMILVARRLLKSEWVRIKDELTST